MNIFRTQPKFLIHKWLSSHGLKWIATDTFDDIDSPMRLEIIEKDKYALSLLEHGNLFDNGTYDNQIKNLNEFISTLPSNWETDVDNSL